MSISLLPPLDPRGLERINALVAQLAVLTGQDITGLALSVDTLLPPGGPLTPPGTRFLVLGDSGGDDEDTPGTGTASSIAVYMVNQALEWDIVPGGIGGLQGYIPQVTLTQRGLMLPEMLAKLNGVEYGATNFNHPSTHPAAMIDESTERRFVSDDLLSTLEDYLEGGDGESLGTLRERLAHIEWQLAIQGILDGVDGMIIDIIDSPDAVELISGQFANNRVFI